MDEYLKSMKEYSPNSTKATGLGLVEETIEVVNTIPEQTTLTEEKEQSMEETPHYMAPRRIEVKRYLLKK